MSDPGSAEEPEAFVETHPLTDVFGSHPKTKVVSVLLTVDEDPPTHFSVNEIGRIAGLDAGTVEEHVRDLQAFGIVSETDELEESPTFTLDGESDAIADLRQLNATLFEHAGGTDDR